MLSTSNIAIQFGAKPLFEGITVKFADGNRYGLIGANGCGKSTLLALLAGERTPQAGRVVQAAACRCEFVAQQLPAGLSTLSTRAVLLDALGNDPPPNGRWTSCWPNCSWRPRPRCRSVH